MLTITKRWFDPGLGRDLGCRYVGERLVVAVGYGRRRLVEGSGKFARAIQMRAVEHQTRLEKLLGEAKKMENSCRGLESEQLDEKRDRGGTRALVCSLRATTLHE